MRKNSMDELLKGDLKWQMHTTMTIDYAYEAVLVKRAQENNSSIAIFYDGNKDKNGIEVNSFSRPVNPELLLQTQKRCFKVTCPGQTFHAKISLVCYMDVEEKYKYRLMIYSKNHGFTADSCADIALLFDVEFKDQNENELYKRNADNLNQYLNIIHDKTNHEGQKFLDNNGITYLFKDKAISLTSHSYPDIKNIELLFGGCGGECLWKKMTKVGNELKIVLTPPFFVAQSYKDQEMESIKKKNILYERKDKCSDDSDYPRNSHIKLYLFENIVYLGSANFTKPGVGYVVENDKEHDKEQDPSSIECLVGLPIDKDMFEVLKESIEKYYEPFNGNNVFKHVDDPCALYLMNHWSFEECKYYREDGRTEAKSPREAREFQISFHFDGKGSDKIMEWHNLSIAMAECEGSSYTIEASDHGYGKELNCKFKFSKCYPNTGLFIVKGQIEGKEKRYVWCVNVTGIDDKFLQKDSIMRDYFVSDMFLEKNNKEEIKSLQKDDDKYEKNPCMAAFFNALSDECGGQA